MLETAKQGHKKTPPAVLYPMLEEHKLLACRSIPTQCTRTQYQSSDSRQQEIFDLMKAQQESLQRCEESDQKVFEALLKSQAEAQRQHQEFVIFVLGKK